MIQPKVEPIVDNSLSKLDNKARIAQLTAQIQARMANKPNLAIPQR